MAISRLSRWTPHVLARERDALIEDADLHVRGRDLGDEAHQHVVVVGDRGEQLGVGRLDGAAEPAPEIDLPGRIEAGLEGVEVAVEHRLVVQAEARACVRAAQLLRLWKEPADRDAAARLRLEDAQAGRPQRQVLRVSDGDQPPEHRIAEHFPPARRVGGFGP